MRTLTAKEAGMKAKAKARVVELEAQIREATKALAFDLKRKNFYAVGECAREISRAVQRREAWREAMEQIP